ncbi:hypothetical protein NC651_023427 [Populus alba x Populus x berolinensis]|nr:hypothetical protein NC651_023427 [Populus alba x Populus x berolinensis]
MERKYSNWSHDAINLLSHVSIKTKSFSYLPQYPLSTSHITKEEPGRRKNRQREAIDKKLKSIHLTLIEEQKEEKSKKWQSLKERAWNHISESSDIRRLANFYKDIFGFEEIESPKFEFKVIWLKISPDLALHLIERSPDTKLPEGPYSATSPVLDPTHLRRGHHVCFSVSNFDSFVQSLKGIETFQRSAPNRPIRQVFFFDPDGNGLEVASRDE